VTLTPELQQLIDSEVAAGRFGSADEFLRAAVHHFVIARELGEIYSPEEIEEMIARGLAQMEQGETIDGDEAFLQLRSQSAERRRR
jgi:Arc/MetJ-type ribon-helix-helix transcriptional regulator